MLDFLAILYIITQIYVKCKFIELTIYIKMYSYESKKYTAAVFNAIKDILEEDKMEISIHSNIRFNAYL